jgi:hypothetical protein
VRLIAAERAASGPAIAGWVVDRPIGGSVIMISDGDHRFTSHGTIRLNGATERLRDPT